MVGRRSRRVPIIIAAIVVVGIVGFIAWQLFGGTNEATIKPQSTPSDTTASTAPKTLNSSYIRLQYPADFMLQHPGQKGSQLETFLLRGGSAQQTNLSISVANLPAAGLNGDADYFLRTSRPDLYTKHDVQVGSTPVTAWSRLPNDDNQAEETVFLVHNNLVATVAFSQLGGDDTMLRNDLDTLLQTFAWK